VTSFSITAASDGAAGMLVPPNGEPRPDGAARATARSFSERGLSKRATLLSVNILHLERTTDPFGLDAVIVHVDGERLYRESVYGPPLEIARLHLQGVLASGDGLWGDTDEFDDGRVPIAACGCGIPGCDALVARIVVEHDRVVWTDIGQYRDWEGQREGRVPVGPLVFDRDQYESELDRVIRSIPDSG
jgi:hypothetical protein